MSVASFNISSLDRNEVLRYLGYRGQGLSKELVGRVDEGIARALEVGKPRGSWRIFEVARAATTLTTYEVHLLGCTLVLSGHDIAAHLAGAVAVGVLAVTAGMGIDQELRRLAFSDTVGQVVFDAAGSALVERAADGAEARLVAEAAARDQFVNWRFSPGYGDLPLDCQSQVLASVDATRRLGITLTPTNLMVPTKSVTAVIGIFNEPQPSRKLTCAYCYCKDFCTIRKTGRTCHG